MQQRVTAGSKEKEQDDGERPFGGRESSLSEGVVLLRHPNCQERYQESEPMTRHLG